MFNRGAARLVCIALVVLASQVAAPADARSAMISASPSNARLQYRVAMTTLETRRQAETVCIMVFCDASISGDRRRFWGATRNEGISNSKDF